MLDKLIHKQREVQKKAFWPSDVGRPVLDLYLAFKGEPETNPPDWHETLKWGAGKGVEESMLTVLKNSGIVSEDYDQKEHGRIEVEREGVQINGYIDALTKEGLPIEIKSINNKNSFDILKYRKGEPRENYVGQLCIYMDALGVDKGYLFVSSVDGLDRFWFECHKIGDRKYKCGKVTMDLDKVYKRWRKLYFNNVEKGVQPKPTEFLYKYPVKEVDWMGLPKHQIQKARTNNKVIGDWEVAFSRYKDKIVELQGETLGYTDEELEYIKEQTKGYSAK